MVSTAKAWNKQRHPRDSLNYIFLRSDRQLENLAKCLCLICYPVWQYTTLTFKALLPDPSSDKKRVNNWNKVPCPKNSNSGLRPTLHNDCSESFQSPDMKVTWPRLQSHSVPAFVLPNGFAPMSFPRNASNVDASDQGFLVAKHERLYMAMGEGLRVNLRNSHWLEHTCYSFHQ